MCGAGVQEWEGCEGRNIRHSTNIKTLRRGRLAWHGTLGLSFIQG